MAKKECVICGATATTDVGEGQWICCECDLIHQRNPDQKQKAVIVLKDKKGKLSTFWN